ncbi:MAG: hypothetical protein LAT68_11345 [Cyclobacteriaceae bacterium]|nr:hypothetical protein [Cyclobacteriaceae bacterium]MCH8516911.1 hypothetical protein [Cyclobacteriaceae bacterium]
MIKKIITSAVYYSFDLIYGFPLFRRAKELNRALSADLSSKKDQFASYAKTWGLPQILTDNPVQTKADIKVWTEKVDPSKVTSWAYTGGSYGEPLRVPYSKSRNFVRTATFKYFNELAGYQLGDPFVLIRAKNKSAWEKFLRNEHIFIPHDTSVENLKKFAIYLQEKKIEVLSGYPSVIYALAIFLSENPAYTNDLKIKAIISVSEPLEQEKRDFIYQVFECRFIDRYSNEEVGLICQQMEYGGEYRCNHYGIITEVVDPMSNLPVATGEKGKVLVTDIHNDLVPIVRYDTGDLAVAGEYEDGMLKTIRSIEGRVAEQIFSTSGKPISPLILGPYIYKPLSRQEKVFQYQFAQLTEKEYELRIKGRQEDLSQKLKDELASGLLPILGDKASFKIKAVKDILPQPSGKRPIYKNEMNG